MKQYRDAGLKPADPRRRRRPCDDALLKSFGDEAIGVISCSAYTGDLDTPSNKRLSRAWRRTTAISPGSTPPALYINGMVAEAALEKTGGKTDDREALSRRCARCR